MYIIVSITMDLKKTFASGTNASIILGSVLTALGLGSTAGGLYGLIKGSTFGSTTTTRSLSRIAFLLLLLLGIGLIVIGGLTLGTAISKRIKK